MQEKNSPTLRVTFRKAAAADLHHIMKIERDCFGKDAYHKDYINCFLQKSLQGRKTQLVLAFVQAADEPKIAGYALALMRQKKEGLIISIGIGKEFRGQKLSRPLLQEISENLQAAGVQKLKLYVETTNKVAINLYETSGYVKNTRRTKNFYGENRHAYVMSRRLT